MPRNPGQLGSPQEWLKRAKSNLALARQARSEEIFWEDLCFETQQAADKALKAVLIAQGFFSLRSRSCRTSYSPGKPRHTSAGNRPTSRVAYRLFSGSQISRAVRTGDRRRIPRGFAPQRSCRRLGRFDHRRLTYHIAGLTPQSGRPRRSG